MMVCCNGKRKMKQTPLTLLWKEALTAVTINRLDLLVLRTQPGVHNYEFTDVNITSLSVPLIYYRLRLTDIDGRYTYSNIVILSMDSNGPIVLLYPNPVTDMINMTITISEDEKLQWQLIDNIGRTVKSGVYNVTSGSTAVSIDVSALSNGLYFMQLKSSSLQRVIKVIKQ